jgi:hypothetical protein
MHLHSRSLCNACATGGGSSNNNARARDRKIAQRVAQGLNGRAVDLARARRACENATMKKRVVVWTVGTVGLLGALVGAEARAANVFSFSEWASVTPAAGWIFDSGDFNGDGLIDVVGYHPSNGSVWIGANTGASSFAFSQWSTVSPAAGWTIVAGDFTGDGWPDVMAYYSGNGSLWIGANTGSSFSWSQWAVVSPAAGWTFSAADFNGDGRLDLLGYHPSNGSVWVGANVGSAFSFSQWASVTPVSGWVFKAGDYTRDGRPDAVGYHPSNGTVWVGANTGSSFLFSQWSTLSPASGWNLISGGDFAGDGSEDVVAYDSGGGSLWTLRNAGTRFWFGYESWAVVGPASGWSFAPGDFNRDGKLDLFAYHPSNGSLWVGRNTGLPPEGYAWPLSASPGQTISFYASGAAGSTVDFYRHTSPGAAVVSTWMGNTTFSPTTQPLPSEPWRNGCNWATSFTLTIPAGWPSGIYSARLHSSNSSDAYVTFVVKPDPAHRSSVALLANVNTWLAYNDWGGKGKYTGASLASFLRPNVNAQPIGEGFANHHLARGELWIATWLETAGFHPDYYTDIDYHNGISNYPKLVVGTHPEYWSFEMYDSLQTYVSSGGHMIYLGGNGLYEHAVYNAGDTSMTFLNGVEDGPREPAMFRFQTSPPRPERSLLGVATERCSAAGKPYVTDQPSHAIFAGTGLSLGQTFGNAGLNTGGGTFNGMASAWEVDTSDGPGAIGAGCNGGTPPANTLPAGLVVLAHGQPDGSLLGAEMTYYSLPGGGSVFSAGSITFGGSLAIDPAIQQIVTNVLNLP